MTEANSFVLKRIGTYDLTGNRLGKGNFAFVELATNRVTKSKVAIKVIDTKKIKDDYVRKNVLREALLLKKVNHPNIVRLYETLKQRSIYCIVTEYVPGGELLSLLRCQNDSKLSESQARLIIRQLVSALHHMHEQGIVHRDLKMENILLDETKKNIKIVDFGLSNICLRGELLKTQCGSPEYAAPELFRKGCQYGTEVDLWSLGIIMYGTVVGRLPFRSPHSGNMGRNDLVEQMSRGLGVTHNKYLVRLTPQCRDLLRKLIEPNPQMRWPLVDVMVHPWVTLQGTQPLVPYSVQPTEDGVRDKVLEKTSQLIKIEKSKIAFHVQRNNYDAISGVYHLLLDEELRNRSKANINGKHETAVIYPEEGSFMRVSIKPVWGDGKQSKTRRSGSEGDLESISHDSNDAEQECEPLQSGKPVVDKQRIDSPPVERPLNSLQVKGIRICRTEMHIPNGRACPKTRPNTACADTTSSRSPGSQIMSPACLKHQPGTKCRSCKSRHDGRFENKVRGRRMVISPRVRQTAKVAAARWALKIEALESEKNYSQHDGGGNSTSGDDSARLKTPETGKDEKSLAQNKKAVEIHLQSACPEDKQITESDIPEEKITGSKVPPTQNFVFPRNSSQTVETGSKRPPSSLAAKTRDKVTFPIKTSALVNIADYQRSVPHSPERHVPQPPKKPQSRGSSSDKSPGSRLGLNVDGTEDIIESFSTAYQSYMKNNKPQHRRLSIMQAHAILQHESKFHAKYGRKQSAENGASAPDCNKPAEMSFVPKHANEEHLEATATGTASRICHGNTGTKSNTPTRAKQRQPCVASREGKSTVNSVDKHGRSSRENLNGSAPTADRRLHEESPSKNNSESGKESRGNDYDEAVMAEARLTPRQEESLKRQKEKEQMDGYERERARFWKEFEDQERQKMVHEYLDNVYAQNQVQTAQTQDGTRKSESNQRSYRVTKHHRLYSLLPRPARKSSAPKPHIVGKATPLWNQAPNSPSGERRISFKQPHPHRVSKGYSGVRFQNEWNSDAFRDYVNSPEGTSPEKRENDHLQSEMNDASYWLQHHLYGVVDEASAKRDLPNYTQIISRGT